MSGVTAYPHQACAAKLKDLKRIPFLLKTVPPKWLKTQYFYRNSVSFGLILSMPEENYKPEARCRFYGECTLYNLGVLSLEAEVAMCGKGQPKDDDYIPEVPVPAQFTPSKRYAFEPEGARCDAFLRFAESHLIGALQERIDSCQKLFQDYLGRYDYF